MSQTTSAAEDTMIEPPNYAFGWYAPLVSHEVCDKKIKGFNYMGKALIAFRNTQNNVVVLDAVCPHFGADLSKGDLCGGEVRCYFHGLYFNEDGQCTKGDLVQNVEKLQRIKAQTYCVEECAGQIWIWHGPNINKPDIPLPIKDLDWENWSTPVTSRQRTVVNSNMCYLTENIIDLQHFAVVHKWQVHEVADGPRVDEEGNFIADLKVTNNPGAQSPYAIVRAIAKPFERPTRLRFTVYSPGLAVTLMNDGLEVDDENVGRSIVVIFPIDEKNVSIRVAVCFKQSEELASAKPIKRKIAAFKHWLVSKLIAAIAVKDFDGDLKVWNNRKYLSNPRLVKEDGPMILFRKWYLRFWHQDYQHELINHETTGNKIPSIRSAQI